MANDTRAIDESSDDYDYPDSLERSPLVRAVLARWKHAIVLVVVALTAWVLYDVGGEWTLDAMVFAAAAVGVVVYSLATLRTDLE